MEWVLFYWFISIYLPCNDTPERERKREEEGIAPPHLDHLVYSHFHSLSSLCLSLLLYKSSHILAISHESLMETFRLRREFIVLILLIIEREDPITCLVSSSLLFSLLDTIVWATSSLVSFPSLSGSKYPSSNCGSLSFYSMCTTC